MKHLRGKLTRQLEERAAKNALRRLGFSEGVDFCSNDYLGLARDGMPPEEIPREAAGKGWFGATGSRLISGNTAFAEELEQSIATFHKAESGLLFTSGYAANSGLLPAVADRHSTILYDRLVHASIRDGIRLSNARSFSFRHNDLADLQDKLQHSQGTLFVVVESVYSMDGDESPLKELAALCEKNEAALIVDEAHATGVFGRRGAGLVPELELEGQVWARVITFGKALGSHGAIVLGPEYLREYLINFCRSFIYTTALPGHSLQAIRWGYGKMAGGDRIERLHNNRDRFLAGLSAGAKKRFIPSRSAIQSLLWSGNDEVKALANRLQEQGFDVRPILHPTVAAGSERLRICLHSFNTGEEIDRLTFLLNKFIQQNG